MVAKHGERAMETMDRAGARFSSCKNWLAALAEDLCSCNMGISESLWEHGKAGIDFLGEKQGLARSHSHEKAIAIVTRHVCGDG